MCRYALVAACAAEIDQHGSEGGFFVLGKHRPAENAQAHMHSSYALALYDIAGEA